MLRKTHWPVETLLQAKLYSRRQELDMDNSIRHAVWTVLVNSKRHAEEEGGDCRVSRSITILMLVFESVNAI